MQDNIRFISFADIKVPEFKEVRGKNYVQFGDDNNFPNKLIEMFDKSSKHNAIVLGKVNYIVGKGMTFKSGAENTFITAPNPAESLNELVKKCCIDIEVFGGFYTEVHWNDAGSIGAMYHMPYQKVRSNKDNTEYHIKDWTVYDRKAAEVVLGFNPANPHGKQIFFYKEYRPNVETYTLPNYLGALNWIETDIEVSKYHLSVTKNGMFSSKMISFFQGVPSAEEQTTIEKRFKRKFTGSENAGNIVLTFNDDPAKKPEVIDLSATDLDKHFDILNKTIQQEIFAGHQITSPMLFGIKTEGQLGGRNEMREAFEIFKSTYCNDKQQALEQTFTELAKYWGINDSLVITPIEPIGIEFSENTLVQFAPKAWILEKLGIDLSKYPELQQPEQTQQGALANVTGRQQQQLLRIVRLFTKGQLTKAQAALQLKAFGLTDEDVNAYLGLDDDPNTEDFFSSQSEDDKLIAEFAACGEKKSDYLIVQKQKVFGFADDMISTLEAEILDLIKKDKRITPDVIAQTLNVSAAGAQKIIDNLENTGRLKAKATRIGSDIIIERTLTQPLSKITDEKPVTTSYKIMYSYEGPQDSRNRAFCARLLELDKLYTRGEIEAISRRLGYSVFDRRGGWWTKPNGEHSPSCRHIWQSQIVIKRS